jgi:cell division septation protein DedD
LTNGATTGVERQTFDENADLRSVQMQPASSPAASVSTASQPENAPPEIFRGYSIEAATSYTKELAEQFVATYRKQGYDAAVERYLDERTNAQKYRVLIGAFATRPAAEQKAAQMAGILMKDYRVVGLK